MTTVTKMESSEEEALFRLYPYAGVYFVQSPTVSFHSPATQRRLTLSHYSSSRGSTNSFLHDKKSPEERTEHGGGDGVEMEEKGGGGAEEEVAVEMWKFVSFSKDDWWVWIWLQISLRVMVSFGVALLFFYLITRPPPPIISLKVLLGSNGSIRVSLFVQIERMNEFQLGEGVDNTGVTTKFLTCNCSIELVVNIKSVLYGLHIHPLDSTLSFNSLPLVMTRGTKALYASSNGPTSFLLYLGVMNKPMYGAGRSMQDILDSGKGLPLVVRMKLKSSFHVVGKLISPKFHHRAECVLILGTTHDKQHKTLMYDNHCNML